MGFLLLSAISQANAAWTVNMAPGATEVSRSVFDLHMTIFWICVVIGVLVFGAMFWSMIVHRRSTGQQPAHFQGILVLKPAITAVSSHTQGLRPYEVIPIALIAAGMSTAVGIRDQDTQIATEAMLLDGGDNKVLAKMVRQGTGKALDDSDQPITGDDVKAVLDGWAADMRMSYEKTLGSRR